MAAPGLRSYETIYNVGLLDDLHNYFPALLYEQNRFSNLTSVFHYVRSQMNRRFNLYAHGAQAFHHQQFETQEPVPIIIPPTPIARPAQQPPTPNVQIRERPVAPTRNEEQDLQSAVESLTGARLMLDLLGLGTGVQLQDTFPPLRRQTNAPGAEFWNQFRAPVVVRPSQAILEQNTELLEATGVPSNTVCAVCQETIQPTDQLRRLRPCTHVYHRSCIDQWFARSVYCPTCRHDIREATTGESAQ